MTKCFVAISDPVHDLLRNLTRKSPLVPRLSPLGEVRLEYRLGPKDLPAAYCGLALHHAALGMPVAFAFKQEVAPGAAVRADLLRREGCLDVTKLDRRCVRDVRLKPRTAGPGMVATELLLYGTGMLRARNDNTADRFQLMLWSRHGRLSSKLEVVLATIRCLNANPALGKEAFDSTNVIYGDALGEIQQLWDRRADTEFLEKVARALQTIRPMNSMPITFAPPANLVGAVQLHIRAQQLWRRPPSGARSLLRRIETILDNTRVDSAPATILRQAPSVASGSPAQNAGGEWKADRGGYDGWMSGEPSP